MKKIVVEEILRFCKVGPKGVILEFVMRGYRYILSVVRDRLRVDCWAHFFVPTTARRWTAISVGALRY